MATHSSILAWKIPWMEDLEGYSPWGRKKSDTTQWLHSLTHSPLSGIRLRLKAWLMKYLKLMRNQNTKYSILCNYFIITMELMIYRQKSTFLFLQHLKLFRALIKKKLWFGVPSTLTFFWSWSIVCLLLMFHVECRWWYSCVGFPVESQSFPSISVSQLP